MIGFDDFIIGDCREILNIEIKVHGITERCVNGFHNEISLSFIRETNQKLNRYTSWQFWKIIL